MEPLDPRLRELVDRSMRAAVPDDATQARSLARLLATLPAGPTPGSDAPDPSAAAPSAAAVGGKLGLKLVIVGLLGGGAIGTAATAIGSDDEVVTTLPAAGSPARRVVPPRSVEAPSADVSTGAPIVAASPTQPPSLPRERVAPSRTRDRKAVSRSVVAPSEDDALLVETGLVAAADAAIERGDGRAALSALRDHAKRFPHGQLALEREALELAARCVLEPTATRDDVAGFLQRHGRTAAAAKVRRHCKRGER